MRRFTGTRAAILAHFTISVARGEKTGPARHRLGLDGLFARTRRPASLGSATRRP
jgi:hypothetical protein